MFPPAAVWCMLCQLFGKGTLMTFRWAGILVMVLSLAFAGLMTGCEGGDDSSESTTDNNGGNNTTPEEQTPEEEVDSDFGNNDPNLVVCMGDSITSGEELPGKPAYPDRLASLTGKNVVNEGVGGVTSTYGLGIIDDVLRSRPGYVLIMYGVNDVHQGVGLSHTLDNLETMVRAARDNHTIPILGTITPRWAGGDEWDDRHETWAGAIRGLASSLNCRLADVAEEFDHDPSLFIDDGMHPNNEGTQVIAQTFAEQL